MKVKHSLLLLIFGSTSFLQMILPPLAMTQPAINLPTSASDAYLNCQQKKTAVVTVYAGSEVGSGSIIRSDGIVITNYHVIKQSLLTGGKRKIYINLQNGETYTGEALLPIEEKKDLALVKINVRKPLETILLDVSQKVRFGESVCAIGSPYNQPGTVTRGTFKEFRDNGDLTSLVLISPGNSGGPLLNAQGKMIGVIKSAWYSSAGKNSGISFATSVADALQFIQRSSIKLPGAQPTQEPAITPLLKASQPFTTLKRTVAPVVIPVPEPQASVSLFKAITIPIALPLLEKKSSDLSKPRVTSFVVPTFPLDSSMQYQR